jgi:branched-chain amino acid transport system permease protein
LPAARNGLLPRLISSYVISGAALAVLLIGFVTLVEMTYHLEMGEELGKSFKLFTMAVDVTAVVPWLVAAVVFLGGLGLFAATVRLVRRSWEGINAELQTRGAA